ncbi:choline ABC transporter ATP-binding protein [Kiloniella laminariae]|uniref:choline ABC transporter ATP-binding protein n=1 Tax=Kiloniella laminariae TaxID=454162 RepID=UPI00036C2273|nr:choline ABC transporter ATP-binding protein [Kiloniella laminariae]
MTSTAVEFKNVDIIFGDRQKEAVPMVDAGKTREEILDATGCVLGVADGSIRIEEGEICVLMGLSGSGKSTLLRAVNGLNKVTRGEVLVQDGDTMVDVASCDAKTLRHMRTERVSMVFQQFALLPWRTVAENVGLGLELKGMPKAEREAIVEEKLKLVSLDKWKDKYAHELSGGMQQRVGLARAFATDADILLMDEPFSALDPLIRDHLQDELLELQRNLKKTIIFVSHDLDEALKIGTHIAIMEGGRIVQYGEPEEIVLNPANEYVAEFVAHMNPLNVLRCASLMTEVENMRRDGDQLILDKYDAFKVDLDGQGAVVKATFDGKLDLKLFSYSEETELADIVSDCVVALASPDITMKRAIELRQATGNPVLLVRDGRLVGVVGDEEIYQGILRQSSIADAAQ